MTSPTDADTLDTPTGGGMSPARGAFAWHVSEGEALTLESAIFQALGFASVCWKPRPQDMIFDSEEAKWAADALVALVNERLDALTAERDGLLVTVEQERGRNQALEQQLGILQAERETLARQVQDLTTDLHTKDLALDQAVTARDSAQNTANDAMVAVRILEEDLGNAKAELDAIAAQQAPSGAEGPTQEPEQGAQPGSPRSGEPDTTQPTLHEALGTEPANRLP